MHVIPNEHERGELKLAAWEAIKQGDGHLDQGVLYEHLCVRFPDASTSMIEGIVLETIQEFDAPQQGATH